MRERSLSKHLEKAFLVRKRRRLQVFSTETFEYMTRLCTPGFIGYIAEERKSTRRSSPSLSKQTYSLIHVAQGKSRDTARVWQGQMRRSRRARDSQEELVTLFTQGAPVPLQAEGRRAGWLKEANNAQISWL